MGEGHILDLVKNKIFTWFCLQLLYRTFCVYWLFTLWCNEVVLKQQVSLKQVQIGGIQKCDVVLLPFHMGYKEVRHSL